MLGQTELKAQILVVFGTLESDLNFMEILKQAWMTYPRVVQQIKTDLKFTDQIRYFDELEKKIKIKFTGISELDLSFQLTMI